MKTLDQVIAETRLNLAKMGSMSDYCDVCGLIVMLVGAENDLSRRESVVVGGRRIYEGLVLDNLPPGCRSCVEGCLTKDLLKKKGGERL